jgi:hypothetical protein
MEILEPEHRARHGGIHEPRARRHLPGGGRFLAFYAARLLTPGRRPRPAATPFSKETPDAG